jgi:hypothetical protein
MRSWAIQFLKGDSTMRMKFPIKLPIFVVFSIVLNGQAHAGVIFKQTQSSDDPNGHHMRIVTEMRIEGGKARADIVEMSDNPFMKQGSYMLFIDEDTTYIVNPKDKTYSLMDLGEMQNMQQKSTRMQEQMSRQGASVAAEDLKIEKTLEEAGPTMLGMPTQHVIYEVSYKRPVGPQNGPVKMRAQVQETYEIWATHALEAKLAGAAAFKKQGGATVPSPGSAELPQVQASLSSHGMALKTIQTSDSKMSSTMPMMFGGGHNRSKSTMEITDLREESLKPDLFELPKGYTETEMSNPNAGGMPDLNQIPGGRGPSGGPGGPSMPPMPQMPDLDKMPK